MLAILFEDKTVRLWRYGEDLLRPRSSSLTRPQQSDGEEPPPWPTFTGVMNRIREDPEPVASVPEEPLPTLGFLPASSEDNMRLNLPQPQGLVRSFDDLDTLMAQIAEEFGSSIDPIDPSLHPLTYY